MALDGQVSYLSTDFPGPDIERPRTPRRLPRLRMDEEDEEDIDNERTSQIFEMRAPIIGYEVIDQRQKFTVRLRAICCRLKIASFHVLSFILVNDVVQKL